MHGSKKLTRLVLAISKSQIGQADCRDTSNFIPLDLIFPSKTSNWRSIESPWNLLPLFSCLSARLTIWYDRSYKLTAHDCTCSSPLTLSLLRMNRLRSCMRQNWDGWKGYFCGAKITTRPRKGGSKAIYHSRRLRSTYIGRAMEICESNRSLNYAIITLSMDLPMDTLSTILSSAILSWWEAYQCTDIAVSQENIKIKITAC